MQDNAHFVQENALCDSCLVYSPRTLRERYKMTCTDSAQQQHCSSCFICINRQEGQKVYQCPAWKSRMPSVAEPNLVPSSLRSAMSCSTNADDESDSAAPITIASSMLLTDASFGDCTMHWHWSAWSMQTQSSGGCGAPGSPAPRRLTLTVTETAGDR